MVDGNRVKRGFSGSRGQGGVGNLKTFIGLRNGRISDGSWIQTHSRVIQQLKQRKKDPNLTLKVRVVEASENRLAQYLVEDGARNKTRLVVYRRMSSRVREL